MTPKERQLRITLRDDFPTYARRCLKIRPKAGPVEPLRLNAAQMYLHSRAEDQLKRTGKVRLVVLKGRQQGISTYIQGRLYWRATHRNGWQVFILTHEQQATDNLFAMTERFHHLNNQLVKPVTGASNAKHLKFSELDSGYMVATAGSKGVGRSATVQGFHGSEVAFWPNAAEHSSGVLQAIPDLDDTEAFLESTANEEGDEFHLQWAMAVSGRGQYEAVFIPWFWDVGYTRDTERLSLSEEDQTYKAVNGLTDGQMAWRANKIAEFKGDESRFQREYPANPDEAFQGASEQSFINPTLVQIARKASGVPFGPKLLGVDVARFGDDMTVFARRQGRVVTKVIEHPKRDTMQVVGLVKIELDSGIDYAFIDVIGIGAGVVDRLREMGYGDKIIAVNAGESALDEKKYMNKRAEMYGVLRDWLKEQPAQVPNDDALQADLCVVRYTYTSNSQYQLESKKDLKKRLRRSPDKGDAVALTFAQPVAAKPDLSAFHRPVRQGVGAWMG
jgi:hypothetical protein